MEHRVRLSVRFFHALSHLILKQLDELGTATLFLVVVQVLNIV